MTKSSCIIVCIVLMAVLFMTGGCASASELHDFTSDGCSLFPDGTMKDRALWCDCCLAHDMAYWGGGAKEKRMHADEKLRQCVFEHTGNKALADMMYDGVRAGGHPAFPTWYRWGYGWKYGRGYTPLTKQEKLLIQEKLDAYRVKHPSGHCREMHVDAK